MRKTLYTRALLLILENCINVICRLCIAISLVLLLTLKSCMYVIRRSYVAISLASVLLLVSTIGYSAITTHSSSTDDVITLPTDSSPLSFILASGASVDQTHILTAIPVPATLPLFISSTLSGLVAMKSEITVKHSWFVLSNQVGNRGQAMFLYVYKT